MLTLRFKEQGRTPLEQLINTAKSNKLYDQEVLDTLATNDEKLKYLQMLSTANSLALDTRMEADGYSYADIYDKQLKYYALENEYELALQEKLNADTQYQQMVADNYSKQLNTQFAEDTRISGNNAIKTVVDTKYSGDYSAFMSEYKDEQTFFADEYLAYADSYDETETAETLKYMQESASTLKSSQDMTAQLLTRKTQLLENIAADRKSYIERTAYENASWVVKAGSSMIQLLAAPATEIGNVVEGLMDTVLTLASGTVALFGGEETSDTLLDWVAKDTIPLDTLLSEVLPYSYITSPYAKDNPLKWLYEIETSIIDMAPMALNLVAPYLGTLIYYASSAGRTAESYTNEYADAGIGQIIAYTTTSTAIEVLTEKLNTDVIFGKGMLDNWIKTASSDPVFNFVKEAIGEGIEEVASEIGSQLTASILRGENKFDGTQILRAGALGAATSVFLQGGNIANNRRRLLGINTTLTNTRTGMSLNLNARDSAIVEDFLNRSQTKLDAGEKLSKYNQQIYDTLKSFDISRYTDGKYLQLALAKIEAGADIGSSFEYSAQTGYTFDTEDTQAGKYIVPKTKDISYEASQYTDRTKTTFEIESRGDRNIISQRTTLQRWESKINGTRYNMNTGMFDITAWQSRIENLVNTVNEGASDETIDKLAQEFISDKLTESMTQELHQMAGAWTNALLSADENSQAVLNAVNNYYNDSLQTITDRLSFTPHKSQAQASKLSAAFGTNVTLTTDTDKNGLRSQLLTATKRAYPSYTFNTFISDSDTTPVVTVIGKDIYVDHRYLRSTNITSVVKQIETQVLTENFYWSLNQNAVDMLVDARKRMYDLMFMRPERQIQIEKQIAYSALFVPGNELSISLSELDHEAYTKLKTELEARAKEQNIAIKNVAYRGMRVYDLTILKRLSSDEAISKNLLTNNYSIDDLMNELGPKVERYTFKYGIDASKAGVRVLSAIRHLSDMFGFETDINNFYQALSDIKNPDKYKNFAAFEPILKHYEGFSYDQAINLYLRDQFNFEIDPRGTILATSDIESILDENKVLAAYKLGKPIALTELLTAEGQDILPTTDCVVTFIDNLKSNGTTAGGMAQTSIRGKGLIQLNKNTQAVSEYIDCAHEIQHYLTWHNHQPFGATQLFKKNLVNAVYKALPKSEQVPFLRSMVQFVSESLADTATSKQRYEDILKFPDKIFLSTVLDTDGNIRADMRDDVQRAIYWRYDVDEQQSNFRITRIPIDATGAYFQNTGIGPIVLNMSTNLSDSAYNFLKHFNGKSVLVQTADVDALLNQITDGTATFDDILSADTDITVETTESLTFEASEDIYAKLEKVLNLRGVRPTVKQLCQPMFWANNCIDANLKAKYAGYTPTDCKRAVARITGLTFDNFQGKFVKPTELYQPKDYIKYIDDTALVLNRDDNVVIQLPSDYTPGKYISLDTELDKLTDEQTDSAVYYVDDRVFSNLREAVAFTDKSYISASQAMNKPDNPLLTVFDQFIDNMQQVGFTHAADFVLVTHDGKIVSYDSKGNPAETLKMFAEKLKLPWKYLSHGLQIDPTTGKYVGTLESGVMKQLLDAKKVMRAYRKGSTWEAFGKPNYVQDLMLRQMNATNASVSYLQPGDGTYEQYITGKYRLVVNKDGKVAIDRGNRAEYPEVSWKNNVWYGALMRIIEKYDIRTLSELKELGFNDDFIDGIRRNYGRAIQGKTSKKLGLGEDFVEASRKYSGLAQDVINQFINDESAHPFARNLLIQNAQARKSTENLNWAMCSHIRTVEDVDRYTSALTTYSGTLLRKNNNKKYATLNELIAAAKAEYISGDDTRSLLSTKKLADISYSNIVSLFLNIDSRQEAKSYRDTKTGEAVGTRLGTPEGLDFSLSGFQAAAGNIMRGYAATMKSADDIGKTVSDETSGTGTSGRKSDDESNYSRIETSSEAIAKSILENAETKLGTQENLEYLRVYQRGIAATMQYVNANKIDSANKALDKLRSIIENENAKVTVGEDNAWDPYLKQLYDGTMRLSEAIQRGETQKEATKQGGLDDVITEMRQRIEQAEDKRSAQDTEYQAATSNRARLIRQYGEKGYKRILDAVSAKAIFGDTTAQSNVKDNISKRLRTNGSASIYARIDKYFEGPANTKLKELADNLKTFRDHFEGIIPGTEGYSEMRFRYSNLLTKFYEFVKAQTTSAQQAAKLWTEIKTERLEIAKYLDDLVLSGNYNFGRIAEPGVAMYIDAAEQLASGNITMDEFAAFKDASFETRIEMLQALITTGLESDFPRQIIDRMQRILDDATITTDTTESLKKPRIDLSVLKLAQQRAGLSEDASSALDSVITKVNEQYSDTRSAKAEASEQRQLLTEANNAAFNTKYMTWSYDRLSKEYRKYLNSPAITQAEAEDLIRHAALMIENFDYQTKSDAFMKRAKKAWQLEDSKAYKRVKALIYYGTHGEWPKYYSPPVRGVDLNNPTVGGSNEPTSDEIAMAIRTRKQYIDAKIESQIHDAASARKPQKSAIQPERLSEENKQNRAEFIRQHIQDNFYEQLARLSATESYNDTTKLYKESIERTVKQYLSDTNFSENVDYILAQLGYPNKPLEDPVQIREINAILDLYIDRQRNNISHGTYLYERNRALSNLRNKSLDEFIKTELESRKANLTAAADAIWWNSYNKSREYGKRPSEAEHTYAVPQIRRQTADQVKSVQELLKMYIEQNIQQTPSLDDLPKTERYYTTHKTLDKVLEDAETGMKIRNTDEDATLNNIINGISIAITEFQYRPMTLASAIKFINDVRTILVDKTLNKSLFSWKNNVPTEKLKRFAFTEFTRNEAGERVAEETSIPSFNRMMKYLKSGQFTSHAQELDVELQEAAKQISDASDKMSNAVQTLLEEMKDVTVTEEDQNLESDLSRQMRQEQEAEWDEALDDAFNEIITDMTESLDFDSDFYDNAFGLDDEIDKLRAKVDPEYQLTQLQKLMNDMNAMKNAVFQAYERARETSAVNDAVIPENAVDWESMGTLEFMRIISIVGTLYDSNFIDRLFTDSLFDDDQLSEMLDTAQEYALQAYSNGDIEHSELKQYTQTALLNEKRAYYIKNTYNVSRNIADSIVRTLTGNANKYDLSLNDILERYNEPDRDEDTSWDYFGDIIDDITELLVDDDFDFEFDDTPDEVLQGEPIQLEELEDVVDFEDELTPKAKKSKKPKTDDRPLDEQFKPEDEAGRSSYKTTRSELLTRNGVDITKALEYQFKETTSIDIYGETIDRQRTNTQEFITNPEVSNVLTQLLKNEAAMKDFLVWLAEARSIDELTSLKALIILNKIEASPTISFEIRKEAQKIRKMKKSIAGAILGLGNRHGLTPVEEVNLLAMEMFRLTKDELADMKVIKDKQQAAIDAKDFNAADAAMKEALEIFKKHQHELNVSLNPFGKTEHSDELAEAKHRLTMAMTDTERKTIQEEVDRLRELVETERAARWHNLTSKITTWRYFAMLSAPATFFAKNLAGNYVAQGLNRVSEVFASRFEKLIAKKRGFKYTRTGKRASESAVAAVDKQLVASGLLDGMMSNTVAKYDTGYAYRPSAVRNLTIDAVDDNLDPNKLVTLQQVLRADSPFGKFDENGKTNIFAAGLNKMYGIIFGTMDKYDKKFMRADILRLTEQLVSDNFSEQELSELTSNTMSEATLNKFYEIVEFARQEACKTYFRSQPKLYNDIMMLLNKYPMAQAIVSTIMPFPRMVINATMTALAYSPLGFIKMAMTLKTDKSMFANIRASQEFGKACTGTVAMVVGIILAALGILDIDDEDPYTGPQLTIGDLRIALEGLEPSATPFIMGAMSVLGNKYDNTNVFAAGADALLESTVLGEMMSQFGNDDTGTKWIGSLFASYVTQFIPTVLRRTTQLIDPGKKNYTGNGKFLKRIAATIPLLSFAVEDKIDPYTGNPQVQHNDAGNAWVSRFLVLFNAISPTKISWNSDSAVEIESKAVDAATTGPAQTITKKGVDYKIPKKLYNQYKILRAQLYSQYASELIKTEAYKKLSNEKKAQKLKALQTHATNEARKQLNINSELNIP